jgi:hypothetical protein
MPPTGRRWFVEIMEVEGRCRAMLGYSYLPGRTVIWDTVDWTIPAQPVPTQAMLGELFDACLVLMERQA